MRQEYLLIGEVLRPQGIRGELKLRAESQDESRYARLAQVWLRRGDAYEPRRVLRGRAQGGFAYLTLEGVSDRNAAEALRGTQLYVDRENALQLSEGEHFVCDLIGLAAQDETGAPIGTLREVIQSNPNCDVYAFDTPRGNMMIPALKKTVLAVDPEGGTMTLSRQGLAETAVWEDEPEERDE